MSQWDMIINAIDFDHNKTISSAREIQKAKELGFDAQQGQKIEEIIEKSSKITLQEALQKIDQTQTVDNKDNEDPFKKKLNILG